VIDISCDYDPSPAMLSGEPYVLEYKKNIHQQMEDLPGFVDYTKQSFPATLVCGSSPPTRAQIRHSLFICTFICSTTVTTTPRNQQKHQNQHSGGDGLIT
jgi:hypothetical protein